MVSVWFSYTMSIVFIPLLGNFREIVYTKINADSIHAQHRDSFLGNIASLFQYGRPAFVFLADRQTRGRTAMSCAYPRLPQAKRRGTA